jgi:phenylacetate-CoA ligase
LQREATDAVGVEEIQQITKELQHHIKTVIGISTRVKVFPANSLQRTETGKARRVMDNRPKQI